MQLLCIIVKCTYCITLNTKRKLTFTKNMIYFIVPQQHSLSSKEKTSLFVNHEYRSH